MVRIEIAYEGGLRCRAVHTPSGEVLVTDAPVDNHGKGESFSPTDLVAAALGTCVTTIMGIIAEREGLDLSGMRVIVNKEMTSAPRRRIGKISVTLHMPAGLTRAQREKLETAARQCPVRESLAEGVETPMEFIYE